MIEQYTKTLARVMYHASKVDEWCEQHNCQRVFTALCGSQNYKLDNSDSDVDTKSLVIPNFHDFVLQPRRISITMNVDNSEDKMEIKDAREMVDCWLKQNSNFIEILFTPYVDIAPKYVDFYSSLTAMNDSIARYDEQKTIRVALGHMNQKHKQFMNSYGVETKPLYHMLRLKDFITAYEDHQSYEDCLVPTANMELIKKVRNNTMALGDMIYQMTTLQQWSEDKIAHLNEDHPSYQLSCVKEEMEKWLVRLFRYTYKGE